MDPKNKRQPVPAGGQPTPDAVAAADATPPAAPAADATPPAAPAADATPPAADPAPGSDAGADNDAGADEPEHDDEPVEARVLVAFGEHEVNDVFVGSADEVERHKLAGAVDPHPDAVAYAKGLDA